CVAENVRRMASDIDLAPGAVVCLRVLIVAGRPAHAVLVSSTPDEFEKLKHKLIALAPSRLPAALPDSGAARSPNNVSPSNARRADLPAGAAPQKTDAPGATAGSAEAVASPPAPTPEVVSAFQSVGDNVAILTLYRKAGDKFAPLALGELKGKIEFNSQGIVGSVDSLSRLQFAEPKDKWLAISQRSVVGGKALVTTEDGKSYTISNLGMRPFAGQIEPSESSPSSTAQEQTTAATPAGGNSGPPGVPPPPDARAAPNPAGSVPQTPEQQAFAAATQSDSALGWETFLKRYPAGKHTQEARQSLDAVLFNEALLAQTYALALETIFHRCRTPAGADKVFALWDEAAFQSTQQIASSDAYSKYLQRFPKGAHLSAVQAALE